METAGLAPASHHCDTGGAEPPWLLRDEMACDVSAGRRPWWWGRLAVPLPVGVSGGPSTPGQARGPRWRRTVPGLFVPEPSSALLPEQRILEVGLSLRRGGVSGWAALRWYGGTWFHGRDADGTTLRDVPVASALHLRTPPHAVVTEERIAPSDFTCHDGLVCTTPVRSVFNEMRASQSLWQACVVAEMAFFNDLVSLEELRAYVQEHPRLIGVRRARDRLGWLDENTWSPQEVRMRDLWTKVAELPRPQCNVPVFDRSGALVGVPDLLDEEAGLVGEYDGAVHLHQRRADLDREARFRALGLEYVTMVAGDAQAPERMAGRIRAARRRAGFRAPSERAWTLQQPHWWVPRETVEQRRELWGTRHERLLHHRRLNR